MAGCSRGTLFSSSATTSCISTRALWLPDSFCSTEKYGIQWLPAAPPAPALPTWAVPKAPSGPVMPDSTLQATGHPFSLKVPTQGTKCTPLRWQQNPALTSESKTRHSQWKCIFRIQRYPHPTNITGGTGVPNSSNATTETPEQVALYRCPQRLLPYLFTFTSQLAPVLQGC